MKLIAPSFRALLPAATIFFSCLYSAVSSSEGGYYDSLEGITADQLKKSLHDIIDDHRVIPYTNSGNHDWHDGLKMDVWEALVYTDSACPEIDPQCGMVQLLYLPEARSISLANRGSGTNDSWDREHVWPKSRGFSRKKQDGYTDLHHLRPADRNINGTHSNYGYDVGGKPVLDKLGDGDKQESGAFIDRDNASFEPTDQAKGQVARMLFYMAVRYEEGDNGPDEAMPDLYLQDTNERASERWIGDLCTLLEWNKAFPVQGIEIQRNNRIMEIQGNRNPFIDQPLWADVIWGSQCAE